MPLKSLKYFEKSRKARTKNLRNRREFMRGDVMSIFMDLHGQFFNAVKWLKTLSSGIRDTSPWPGSCEHHAHHTLARLASRKQWLYMLYSVGLTMSIDVYWCLLMSILMSIVWLSILWISTVLQWYVYIYICIIRTIGMAESLSVCQVTAGASWAMAAGIMGSL